MHDLKLHIDQIIRFSDQFATFFKDSGLIVAEDSWMAGKSDEPWGRNFVFPKAEEVEAWSLLWNTDMKEFLLLHYVASKGRWFYRFAPDSKEVLKVLNATSTWRAYFGLIDLAHVAAYGTPGTSDRKFLEHMMTDALFLPGGVAALRKEAEKSINQMPHYVTVLDQPREKAR
jgi:hypothetical protein